MLLFFFLQILLDSRFQEILCHHPGCKFSFAVLLGEVTKMQVLSLDFFHLFYVQIICAVTISNAECSLQLHNVSQMHSKLLSIQQHCVTAWCNGQEAIPGYYTNFLCDIGRGLLTSLFFILLLQNADDNINPLDCKEL